MTHILTTDIYSTRKTLYGKRGDKVRIISVSPPAVVVENEKGDRFPINEKQIKKTL